MKIENPAAFRFIMQEELYLLAGDRTGAYAPSLPAPFIKTQPVTLNYLGANKKHFLVIVHYPGQENIGGAHLAALESTLKRLEYAIDDAAIFNRSNYAEASFKQITDFFTPQKLLLLGKDALPAGFDPIPPNEVRTVSACRTLFSFSFDEMMDNNQHKKTFWEQMKQL